MQILLRSIVEFLNIQSISINTNLLLAFAWFAVLVSITPGPNCTVALLTSAKFGLASTLPHMLGVMVGFSALLLACSLGAYTLLISVPYAAQALKWAGIAYLIWMGWTLAKSSATNSSQANSQATSQMFTKPHFIGSALFQFANPKAWLLATGAIAAYQPMIKPFALCVAIMTLICAAACALGIFVWAYIGSRMQHWVQTGARAILFNRVAGFSLILTALTLI
jgi:threonine/homoserine/homoserine lactone efflux protein